MLQMQHPHSYLLKSFDRFAFRNAGVIEAVHTDVDGLSLYQTANLDAVCKYLVAMIHGTFLICLQHSFDTEAAKCP